MKQKLTKGQVMVLRTLSKQREEVIQALQEIAEAEQEQLKMLVAHFDLPKDKEYFVRQEGEDVFLMEQEKEIE